MNLQHRRIQKTLEAHSQTCATQLNEKLGTNFEIQVDWSCLPDDISGWNWQLEDLESLLYHSYYRPIETGLTELFADEFYKEAILEQIKRISVKPGGCVASFEFAEGEMKLLHTLGVNQKNGGGFFDSVVKNFKNTVLKSLS